MNAEPGSDRLFFALWPSAVETQSMADYAAGLVCQGGRRIGGDRLHLTLAFIGSVARERRPAIEAMAASLDAADFVLAFDRIGLWRRSGIVWTGCSVVPPAAAGLAASLRDGLAALELPVERRAFRPHVTLFRRARGLAPAEPPALAWACREFVLVGSELEAAGARYRVLARFGLGAGAASGV
ncbi:MAG: RNA 2',3'-cyclic phosphodiesterase [Zoogloeaceae bacterium]|nr:RNA 2',3'-cyclic phosphodiesterase [Rhodocyclaceae bacterium]MCP5236270.1 RNA 2',3'-cyclic phosphodiesterase [Zoogloeaceae bacterium]